MILVKHRRYIGDINKISEIFWRVFQKIGGIDFDFLTSDLTTQIGSYFDPRVHISSTFEKASNGYFFIQLLILNMKLDLTVHIDFQRIYDDLTIRFQPKSNPIVF